MGKERERERETERERENLNTEINKENHLKPQLICPTSKIRLYYRKIPPKICSKLFLTELLKWKIKIELKVYPKFQQVGGGL